MQLVRERKNHVRRSSVASIQSLVIGNSKLAARDWRLVFMLGRLRGILAERRPPELLVDVNGVYYEVQVPMTSIYRLPEVGSELTLHTHFSVSENLQQLFGFADKRDRELFRTLIKVSGVGPKLGLSILSGMEAD